MIDSFEIQEIIGQGFACLYAIGKNKKRTTNINLA